ncbi:DUF4249 domain-containing protein [Flavobacterium selenitireducens]|uniref:DUF4249 domain-containing protein n=1 Tax=Flavobacterium selenitireducens TaxID=2722704 RepID=UPI00168ABCA2|nr:DUF4249 domain-containing protein [Flavobacterium selenitireducens]MBD3583302.1 DUF4249 domain-containing protein [Flavobacterium selenitireducens]
MMNTKNYKYLKYFRLAAIATLLVSVGCTDPYALQTRNFESAIVIEATLTNEMKQHAFKISRTYRFNEEQPFESDADVYVEDDAGNVIQFEQQDTMYVSQNAFLPDPERSYTLHVTTSDGKSYSSTPEKQTAVTSIGSLSTQVMNMGEQQGVQISVNSSDPTGLSKYYRYEYEEAGRFRTPLYSESQVVIGQDDSDDDDFKEIYLWPRTVNVQTCYRINKSNRIILTSTNELSSDNVQNFPVRFIPDTSYILNDRYAIKVRQYVQNLPSYTFYKTLSEISSTGNILSQTQPGFFFGNIRSDQNPEEKVIGFFQVCSVSEAVVRFSYNEIFPNNLPIPWPYECSQRTLDQNNWSYPRPLGDAHVIIDLTEVGSMEFYSFSPQGFYILASDQCVDCTITGKLEPPAYWEN